MLKKIGLTILAIILAYNTIKLVMVFADLNPNKFSLLAIIVSAFAFNLMITGVFAFLGFAFPTSKILPNTYYKIRKPETIDFLYKMFGVKYFKLFLLKTFYRKEDNKKYFNGTKAGIISFDFQTKQSEFGHLLAFLVIQLLALYLLSIGFVSIFFHTTLMNIILNFYPIILQRKHRIQIERLLKRASC